MVNALKTAIEKVRELPEEEQKYVARVISYIADRSSVYRVPQEHRAAILKGLRESKQGKFASAAAIKKALHTRWT